MQSTFSLRPSGRSRRSTRRSRRSTFVRWAAATVGLVVAGGGFIETASAVGFQPEGVSGDPHSPEVARLAAVALESKRVRDTSPSAESEQAYNLALSEVATATAHEFGVSRLSLEYAWQRADSEHQTAVLTALTQLGVEYQSNSSEPFVGFDCSGLTSFAWSQAGRQLSRQSGSQISEAEERSEDTAMAGDLVQYPGHVMLYLGIPDAVVHASNPENDVELYVLGDRSVSYADPSGLPVVVVAPVAVTTSAPIPAVAFVRLKADLPS